MSVKDFLQKLSEAHGISGYEHAVRDLVIEEFRPYADEISVTKMGSVVALKRGARALLEKEGIPGGADLVRDPGGDCLQVAVAGEENEGAPPVAADQAGEELCDPG